jgi:hypothetical protein
LWVFKKNKIEWECLSDFIKSKDKDFFMKSDSRFVELEKIFSFFIDVDDKTICFRFGVRSAFRPKGKTGVLVEEGAQLVYSFGDTGDIATFLYPVSSDSLKSKEDCLIVRVGNYTCHEIKRKIRHDLKKLCSYSHVTSIDGDSNFMERICVFVMRSIYSKNVENKYVKPAISKSFLSILGIVSGAILFKYLMPKSIILAVLLIVIYLFPMKKNSICGVASFLSIPVSDCGAAP